MSSSSAILAVRSSIANRSWKKSVHERITFGLCGAEPGTRFSIEDFTHAHVASGRSRGSFSQQESSSIKGSKGAPRLRTVAPQLWNQSPPEACFAGWRGKGARGRNIPWRQSLEQ
jgi:hypothetical protein